jgi:Ca-activated chloride channel family protein
MESAFRFGDQRILIGLAAIPVLVLLFYLMRGLTRRRMRGWADEPMLARLMPEVSSFRTALRFTLWMVALVLVIVALARPQYGTKLAEVKRKGIEIIIALDVSNSMMAEDIQPNRLENAKMAISRLIDRLQNDKIGLIVFAGDAYIQMPVTTDYAAAKLFLNSISPQIVPRQGTAIGAAIQLAMRSFTPESEKSRAIVIITDGENHEEGAEEAAKEALAAGIRVHTIGIGSPQGVPIPVSGPDGRQDFRKDAEGNVVISKLNEELLKKIAASAEGIYVRATASRTGLNNILDEMNRMEKKEIEMKVYSEFDEQFVYYAGLALLILFIDSFLSIRKSRWLRNLRIFEPKADKR